MQRVQRSGVLGAVGAGAAVEEVRGLEFPLFFCQGGPLSGLHGGQT